MADEKKKEVKHLFGTSEKSDFILNMTQTSAQKLCGIYSIIAVLLLTVMAIPYYFTQHVEYGIDTDSGRPLYLNEKFIFFISTAVLITGFVGFLIFLVANMKNIIQLKNNKSLVLVLIIIALSVVSCVMSADVFASFYGFRDRSEGMLTILGYWGIFSVGMIVTAEKWRLKLADFLVGIGLFQAVTGILQSIPASAKIMPNYFENLFLRFGSIANDNEIVIDDMVDRGVYEAAHVASGFLCSPHALAAVMSVIFAIASIGFIFDGSKKRKIFYGTACPFIAAAAFLTCTVTGVAGITSAALMTVIITIIELVSNKKSDIEIKPSKISASLISVLGITGITAGILFASSAVRFLDEKIIFTDSTVRLSTTSNNFIEYHLNTIGGESTEWIYPYLWDDGLYVAQQNLAFGTGPDNYTTIINYGANLDRSYNEYIDLIETRGIFCFISYAVFVIICIVKMFKAVKGFFKGKNSWIAPAAAAGAVAYLIQAFFNISSVTSTPYLWLMLGLIWSYQTSEEKK